MLLFLIMLVCVVHFVEPHSAPAAPTASSSLEKDVEERSDGVSRQDPSANTDGGMIDETYDDADVDEDASRSASEADEEDTSKPKHGDADGVASVDITSSR